MSATNTLSATPESGVLETPAGQEALIAFDPELAAMLQRILDATVADGAVPGVTLSVSIPGYQPWTGASGIADRQQTTPMEPETLVRIGSVSKLFTAVVVLQLADEGQLELDMPIATWLPDLLRDGSRITVRQLLQHTSGLYDVLEDERFIGRAYSDPEHAWAPEELVAYAEEQPPSFPAGTIGAWDYSSTNYVVLGMLVERITDRTLAQEVRQRIFEPMELRQTFFLPEDAINGVLARGYANTNEQTSAPVSIGFGTASIVSTAADVRRFAEGLFAGGLLKPATLDTMQRVVDANGAYDMPGLAYGLGLMQYQLPVEHGPNGQERLSEVGRAHGHIGGFAGFRAAIWFVPARGITIALGMNQSATDPNAPATAVLNAILSYQGE